MLLSGENVQLRKFSLNIKFLFKLISNVEIYLLVGEIYYD